jgi:hypothetical protein
MSEYHVTVNRHDGPHNYVNIRDAEGRTVIALTDRGVEIGEDMTLDEARMALRVVGEHCRSLYMLQEGR